MSTNTSSLCSLGCWIESGIDTGGFAGEPLTGLKLLLSEASKQFVSVMQTGALGSAAPTMLGHSNQSCLVASLPEPYVDHPPADTSILCSH